MNLPLNRLAEQLDHFTLLIQLLLLHFNGLIKLPQRVGLNLFGGAVVINILVNFLY